MLNASPDFKATFLGTSLAVTVEMSIGGGVLGAGDVGGMDFVEDESGACDPATPVEGCFCFKTGDGCGGCDTATAGCLGDTAGGDDAGLKTAQSPTRSTKPITTFVPSPIFFFLAAGCANCASGLAEGRGGGEIGAGIVIGGGRAN